MSSTLSEGAKVGGGPGDRWDRWGEGGGGGGGTGPCHGVLGNWGPTQAGTGRRDQGETSSPRVHTQTTRRPRPPDSDKVGNDYNREGGRIQKGKGEGINF
jgi:hypothetical protein